MITHDLSVEELHNVDSCRSDFDLDVDIESCMQQQEIIHGSQLNNVDTSVMGTFDDLYENVSCYN